MADFEISKGVILTKDPDTGYPVPFFPNVRQKDILKPIDSNNHEYNLSTFYQTHHRDIVNGQDLDWISRKYAGGHEVINVLVPINLFKLAPDMNQFEPHFFDPNYTGVSSRKGNIIPVVYFKLTNGVPDLTTAYSNQECTTPITFENNKLNFMWYNGVSTGNYRYAGWYMNYYNNVKDNIGPLCKRSCLYTYIDMPESIGDNTIPTMVTSMKLDTTIHQEIKSGNKYYWYKNPDINKHFIHSEGRAFKSSTVSSRINRYMLTIYSNAPIDTFYNKLLKNNEQPYEAFNTFNSFNSYEYGYGGVAHSTDDISNAYGYNYMVFSIERELLDYSPLTEMQSYDIYEE